MKSTKCYRDQTTDFNYFNYSKTSQKGKIQQVEPKNKKQLLCKISFEIDGEQEELFIYQNTTLDQIMNELLQKIINTDGGEVSIQDKISLEQRKALKDQIKSKIQMIMQCCIDKNAKTQKWKKKLRQIIEQKSAKPIYSLFQPGTNLKQNSSKSIKYFKYKFFNGQNQKQVSSLDLNGEQKSIEIINRAKQVENFLTSKIQQRDENDYSHRLYQLSKRNETIRSEIVKLREQSEEKSTFSQCTFHPNIQRLQFNQQKQKLDPAKNQSKSVFNRLYQGALQKQQMSKMIQKQVDEKHKQQLKKYNFIPKINQCSNEIATLKKKLHQRHGISIYQSLYEEGNKKIKEPEINKNLTFHPKICQTSQKIIQKSRSTKSMLRNLFSPKQNSILKTQGCAENQKPIINYYEQFKTNKQKQKQKIDKKSQRFLKNKQNILIDSSVQKIDRNLTTFSNSKISYVKDHMETDCSMRSLKKSSKTTRQKQANLNYLVNAVSQQKEVFYTLNRVQQISKDKKRRNRQLLGYLGSLSNSGEHSLRQLDIKNSKNYEKQQKRRQRLNPFQFFKLQDTKQEKIKKSISNQNYQIKMPVFNQLSKQAKNKVFSNIFKLLNNTKGQQIYSQSIYKCEFIPIHIKKILYPMAEQMQQLNVGLDEQQFIWSLVRIFQNISQRDQGYILQWGRQLDFSSQIII